MAALPSAGCGAARHGSVSSASRSATAPAGTTAAPSAACTPAGVAAVARFLRVREGAVVTRAVASNSAGAPQCNFTVRVGPREVRLWVSVNSSPQPYAVLERAAVENGQNFANAPQGQFPVPQHVAHLGLDAYWFPGPAAAHLLTTDAVRLITATIIRWPGVPRGRWSALAAAAARPYLRRSQPRLARGPAP
ncbi:MAG TPA: hypothetical protein VGH67_02925 [Solirubrobacteraceae bacterium]